MAYKAGYDKINGYIYKVAYIHEGGEWSFPNNVDDGNSLRYTLTQATGIIEHIAPDLILSHLFCEQTAAYLSMFELMGIQVIGATAKNFSLVTDKGACRGLMELFNLPIPKGILLDETANIEKVAKSLDFPCVVKPSTTENSLGISLVYHSSELEAAVDLAFSHSSQVVIEDFIPGREIRVGVIENVDGDLIPLPPVEYKIEQNSIRSFEDKLEFGAKSVQQSRTTVTSFVCSKEEKELVENLHQAVIRNHTALGCRDFSLIDCRISSVDGSINILECNVFCTFSPKSVINKMWEKLGRTNAELMDIMVQRIEKRKQAPQRI